VLEPFVQSTGKKHRRRSKRLLANVGFASETGHKHRWLVFAGECDPVPMEAVRFQLLVATGRFLLWRKLHLEVRRLPQLGVDLVGLGLWLSGDCQKLLPRGFVSRPAC
jgi:hypothetical protein